MQILGINELNQNYCKLPQSIFRAKRKINTVMVCNLNRLFRFSCLPVFNSAFRHYTF